jgi:hypothetical protein
MFIIVNIIYNLATVAGLEDPEEDAPKLIKTTHLQSYEPQVK